MPPATSCGGAITGHLRQLTTRVTHVLPVSDDGGSTAEIVRVLGGPAVGDIRSRCLRLADNTDSEVQQSAFKMPSILSYRPAGALSPRHESHHPPSGWGNTPHFTGVVDFQGVISYISVVGVWLEVASCCMKELCSRP